VRRCKVSAQTIFRRAHASNFVAISNDLAREVMLTNSERGLLVWLLSYPPDWIISLQTLVTVGDSLRSLRRTAQRLEDKGYIKRERERDPVTGRLGRSVLFVYEEPLPPEQRTRDNRRKTTPKTENATVEPKTKKRTQAATGSATQETPMTKNPRVGIWPTTKTEEETKTTTKTEAPVVVVDEPKRPVIFQAYEDAFGMMLTPMLADELKLLSEEYTETWVVDAMRTTATAGKRSLSYAKGILRRWQTEGRTTDKPALVVVSVTDEQRAAREKQMDAEREAYRIREGLA
jgi:DnaD/phage-associated family protein